MGNDDLTITRLTRAIVLQPLISSHYCSGALLRKQAYISPRRRWASHPCAGSKSSLVTDVLSVVILLNIKGLTGVGAVFNMVCQGDNLETNYPVNGCFDQGY